MSLLAWLALAAGLAQAQGRDWPRPDGGLGDYARLIDAQHQGLIAALAQEARQKLRLDLVVATLPSLEGQSLEETAARLYRAWGVGQESGDRGALLLVALEQQRVFIHLGPGLAGIVSQAQAGLVRDQVLVPLLRQGRHGQGLYEGLAALAQQVAQSDQIELPDLPRPQLTPLGRRSGRVSAWGWGALALLVLAYLVAKVLRGRSRRPQGKDDAPPPGGGAGGSA
ncbi:MAG: TPM domain-containing protein [Pseudomonadota bacterium]